MEYPVQFWNKLYLLHGIDAVGEHDLHELPDGVVEGAQLGLVGGERVVVRVSSPTATVGGHGPLHHQVQEPQGLLSNLDLTFNLLL